MKHLNKTSILASVLLLTSCLTPQTYFSEVFDLVYEAYRPLRNSSDYLAMNYQTEIHIEKNDDIFDFSIAFFETGFEVFKNGPAMVNGVATRIQLTSLFDYAESGVFETKFFDVSSDTVTKRFVALTTEQMADYSSAANYFDNALNESTIELIHSRVTDLAIGGQPKANNVVTYALPIGDLVDLAQFESLLGFVPTTLETTLTYDKTTFETVINLVGTSETNAYTADIELFNPGGVVASTYLLTPTEKLAFSGYTA